MINQKSDKFNNIALLMGGLSPEKKVSLTSGKAINKTLTDLGYNVTSIDVDRNIAQTLSNLKPDAVFNALHGTYGEDGCIPGLLEILNIPYTHSGVLSSALAMNKEKSIEIFEKNGITCPPGEVMTRGQLINNLKNIKKPCVIKPIDQGSSVGVIILFNNDNLPSDNDIYQSSKFLVEDYIAGKEISVAVTDNKALGALELEPKDGFYDYENKYVDGKTEHFMPARLSKKNYNLALDIAFKAHKILGCKNISRSDFRFDDKSDKLYLMEVNTHPGLTDLSIVPEIAAYNGISFEQLILYLMENASCER